MTRSQLVGTRCYEREIEEILLAVTIMGKPGSILAIDGGVGAQEILKLIVPAQLSI